GSTGSEHQSARSLSPGGPQQRLVGLDEVQHVLASVPAGLIGERRTAAGEWFAGAVVAGEVGRLQVAVESLCGHRLDLRLVPRLLVLQTPPLGLPDAL